MSYIKHIPEDISNNITWPSGPPSRMFKEEGVKPPPGKPDHLSITGDSVQVGAAKPWVSPGDSLGPPGGLVKIAAPTMSGDPGNPRPPTRQEFVKLLKGCDALFTRDGT
ncbi:hypothetical protein [Desulforamulus aquiferis]|uniref:Uncharacterized protein n=1 Tax=Desulforamulus aquiferis TaxID=1397668 RepID=A0AAW7ZBJ5_9FIRM|nr:hypothetical protein [Desulforamulus aquiferis]MDO7786813.1 hypothetical protein [Desulforamulus aquiferis]RYD01337.1 hypothetical protein N752_30550 [Desulforamulus aquiferis]